jgi:hypothetical protein
LAAKSAAGISPARKAIVEISEELVMT